MCMYEPNIHGEHNCYVATIISCVLVVYFVVHVSLLQMVPDSYSSHDNAL